MSMPSSSSTLTRSFAIEAGRVAVLVAHRVREVLVVVHARVREACESHRDPDAVLDEHLLGLDVVVPAHAQALIAHRRWEVPFPEVGRLADVPVGVDDHDVVQSGAHSVPPDSASLAAAQGTCAADARS